MKRKNPATIDELVIHMMSGGGTASFAKKHNIPARTVRSWATSQEARQRFKELRGEVTERAVNILAANTVSAAQELRKLLRSQDESIRIRAVTVALSAFPELATHALLEDRIAEVEKLVQAGGDSVYRPRIMLPDSDSRKGAG